MYHSLTIMNLKTWNFDWHFPRSFHQSSSSSSFNSPKDNINLFMNNTIVHFVTQTYQALKALTVALMTLMHSIKTEKKIQRSRSVRWQRDGFFVECGAFDGEQSSNSLYLEQERGWSGLLVEMDPHLYTQLIGKNRRAWSINACLSTEPYVTQVQINRHGVTSSFIGY